MRLRWNGSQSAQREHLEALARVPKRRKKGRKLKQRRARGSQGSRNGLEPSGLDREYQRIVRGF